jgi:hypothetical protein
VAKTGPKPKSKAEVWAILVSKARVNSNACMLIEHGFSVGIGYKKVRAENHEMYAHQLSDFMARGERPPDTVLLHTCDRPNCINPDHIKRGTHAENVADKMRKGRHRKGVTMPNSLLTDEIIREVLLSPLTFAQCSVKYNVSRGAIHNIRSGRSWNHVTGLPKLK